MDCKGSSPSDNQRVETIRTLRPETLPFAELAFAARESLSLETKQSELATLDETLTTQQKSVLKSQSRLINLTAQVDDCANRLLSLQESADEIGSQKTSAEQCVLRTLKDLTSCFKSLTNLQHVTTGEPLTYFAPPALDTRDTPHAINDLYDFIQQCRDALVRLGQPCDSSAREALDNAIKKTGKLEAALDRYELFLEYQNEHLEIIKKTARELALARGTRAVQTIDLEILLEQVQKMQIDVSYQTADFDEQIRVFSTSVEQIEEHVYGKALSTGEQGANSEAVLNRYKNVLAMIDLLLGREPRDRQKINRLPDL